MSHFPVSMVVFGHRLCSSVEKGERLLGLQKKSLRIRYSRQMEILSYVVGQKWVFFNLPGFLCSATYCDTISNKDKHHDLTNIYYHCNKVETAFVLPEKLRQTGPFPENFNRVAKCRREEES